MNKIISIFLLTLCILLTNLMGIFYVIPMLQDIFPETLWAVPIFENELLSHTLQKGINFLILGIFFLLSVSLARSIYLYLGKVCYSLLIYDSILLQQYLIGILFFFPIISFAFLHESLQAMFYFQGDYIIYAYILFVCAMGVTHILPDKNDIIATEDESNAIERPINKGIDDFLGFTDEIESKIIPRIENSTIKKNGNGKYITNHSFVNFWILGQWGSGKTSYMNLLGNLLKNENTNRSSNFFDKIWVIDFDVSRYSNSSNLYINLYEIILKQIETEIILPFRTKSSMINAVLETVGSSYLRFFTNIFTREINLDEYNNELSQILLKLNKTIVIKVDNLDRLPISDMDHGFKLFRILKETKNIIAIVATDDSALIQYAKTFIDKDSNDSIDNVGKYFDNYFRIPEPSREGIKITVERYIKEVIEASQTIDSNLKTLMQGQINQKWESFPNIYRKYLNTYRKIKLFRKKFEYNIESYGNYIFSPDLVLISIIEATNMDLLNFISRERNKFFNSYFEIEETKSKEKEFNSLLTGWEDSIDIVLELFPLIKFTLKEYTDHPMKDLFNRFTTELDTKLYKEHHFFHEFSLRIYFQSFRKDPFLEVTMNLKKKNEFIAALEKTSLSEIKKELLLQLESFFVSYDFFTFEYREFIYKWLQYETKNAKSGMGTSEKIALLLTYLIKRLPGLIEGTFEKDKVLGIVGDSFSKELIEIIISDLESSDLFIQKFLYPKFKNTVEDSNTFNYLILFQNRLNKKIQNASELFDPSFSDAPYKLLVFWKNVKNYIAEKKYSIEIPDMLEFIFNKIKFSQNRIFQFNSLCRSFGFLNGFEENFNNVKSQSDLFDIDNFWRIYSLLTQEELLQIPIAYRDKLKVTYDKYLVEKGTGENKNDKTPQTDNPHA